MESIFEGLPPTALIAAGVTVGLVFAVWKFGMSAGERASPVGAQNAASVAAVIVDPSALNLLSARAGELTAAILKLVKVGEDIAESQSGMAEEMDRMREEIRIQRELSRRG